MSDRLSELEEIKNKLDTIPNLDYDSLILEVNSLLESQPDPNLYLINAVLYRKTLNFTKSIEYATKAKNLFVKRNDCIKVFECFYEIATCDYEQGKYNSALEQYLPLEDKIIASGIQHFLLPRVQIGIALSALMLARYKIVYEYLNKTKQNLFLVPDYHDKRFKAAFSYTTARLHYDMGKYEESMKYHYDAHSYFEAIGDVRNAQRMMSNVADLCLKLGYFDQAEEIALEMFDKIVDSPSRRSIVSNLLGTIYLEKKQYEKVRDYCSFVAKLDNIDPNVRSLAYKLIALSYKGEGNYATYEKHLERSETLKTRPNATELEKYIAERY